MLTKSSMQESETWERETGFCWSRRDKTSYPRGMRRSHMRSWLGTGLKLCWCRQTEGSTGEICTILNLLTFQTTKRAASQSELGSASTTGASASATEAMAPKSGTPITTTALPEIPRMSLTSAAVEIPAKVPVSGAEQPPPLRKSVRVTPLKRSGRVTGRQKTWRVYVLY